MSQLSKFLRCVEDNGLMYWCQGCEKVHVIYHGQGSGPRWGYNGNPDKPTFTPSVRVSWNDAGVPGCCHTFITDGMVHFLNDCTHQFVGQTLPLPNLPDYLQDKSE